MWQMQKPKWATLSSWEISQSCTSTSSLVRFPNPLATCFGFSNKKNMPKKPATSYYIPPPPSSPNHKHYCCPKVSSFKSVRMSPKFKYCHCNHRHHTLSPSYLSLLSLSSLSSYIVIVIFVIVIIVWMSPPPLSVSGCPQNWNIVIIIIIICHHLSYLSSFVIFVIFVIIIHCHRECCPIVPPPLWACQDGAFQ